MFDYSKIRQAFKGALSAIKNSEELEQLHISYLGRNGMVSREFETIKQLTGQERKNFGIAINGLRNFIANALEEKKQELEQKRITTELQTQKVDISLTIGSRYKRGKKHLLTYTMDEIKIILAALGFKETSGPEIDSNWYNFTALNMPELHPARQMHDTFYVQIGDKPLTITHEDSSLLLRTHTSCVQIRYMENNAPPAKIMSIGRVYRADYDATHSPMFHQAEMLYVGKDASILSLKEDVETFLRTFFNSQALSLRWRSSYFPFTEPSFEVDIQGKDRKWLEVLGCGMVHRNVLKNIGIDIKQHRGYAVGIGIERLAMIKHGIEDLRSFFENDIRWLSATGI